MGGMSRQMSPKIKRFCQEYVVDYNGKMAAIRAGYSARTAAEQAYDILKRPHVQAYIEQLHADTAQRLAINKDAIVKKWWETANANVNDLVQFRRGCCRYCWGINNLYQWTQAEFLRASALSVQKSESPPDCGGGFGFNHTMAPNPMCPECAGEGKGQVHVNDTRHLRGAAAFAYNGVSVGKDGVKMAILDRDKALENVAKHLGMFTEKHEHSVDDGLADILALIAAQPRRLPSEDK